MTTVKNTNVSTSVNDETLQKDNDNNDETETDNETKEISQWNTMWIVIKYGDGDARGTSMRTNITIQLCGRVF